MKYFMLSSNPCYERSPNIIKISKNEISPSDLANKNYYKFNKVTVLPVYERENIDFIDCISSPLFLVSNICMDVIKMYNPYISSKTVVLLSEKSRQMGNYNLPLLPRINCLTSNSKFNLNRSYIEYAQLDLNKVKDRNMFYIADTIGIYVVIRLDVLESMLKRGVRGLKISEIDVLEEVNC